jgi:hypothetical protein
MATTANYANSPRAAVALLSAANTNRDGTGTLVTILAGGASGSRVDDLRISAIGTTTAGMIRFYLSLDNGTTNRLLFEVPVSAITPSGTVQSFQTSLSNLGIVLPDTNALLRASTNNAESFHVCVTRAGNF